MKTNDFEFFEGLLSNSLFAILDVETTGFSPKRGDKIIEIAIVTVDQSGNTIDTYETLVNPGRDVGPTHIHRITAGMVKNAPMIGEVMEDILYHLDGKTIVGHNVDFDLRFINHEISQYLHKPVFLEGLCTLRLSKLIMPDLPSRKLENLCSYFDIENSSVHSALGDCQSTVELFNIFRDDLINSLGVAEFISDFTYPINFNRKITPKNITFKREDSSELEELEISRLTKMISRLPHNSTDTLPVQKYLSLLDDILADRIVTESETQGLYEFISEFKISYEQAIEIHYEYVRKLVKVYLLDNVITENEWNDLTKVCELLSISKEKLDIIIQDEKAKLHSSFTVEHERTYSSYVGKTVCFTGQLCSKLNGKVIDRTLAQQFALERGLIIKSGVSKKLDILVTADPNSMSGKAKKAKEYGIKIIAEPVFWNILGLSVE